MTTLKEAIGQNIQGIVCDGLNGLNDLYGMISARGLPTDIAQAVIDYGRGFACNDADPTPADYGTAPPFSGGQCEGDIYSITISYQFGDRFGGGSNSNTYSIAGKIQSIDVFEDTNIEISGTTFPCGITTVISSSTSGEFRDTPVRGFNCPITLDSEPVITIVNTTTGGSDGCGDPPGGSPDPVQEFDTPLDVVYNAPDGSLINLEDVLHSIKQVCVNQDGIKFAFEVQTPFGKVCGKAGIGVDVGDLLIAESPISPSIDFDLCPSQRGDLESVGFDEKKRLFKLSPPEGFTGFTPDESLNGSNTDEASEDDDPVLAIFVESARADVQNPAGKTILLSRPGQTYPNVIIPYIALARFKVAIPVEGGGFEYAYTEDYRIKSQNAYVPCPAPEGAVSAEVSWEEGWVGTWVEGRAKSCCTNCSEVDPRDETGNIDRCLND